MFRLFSKFAGLTILAFGGASLAQAGGWYHMPTSFCQCMGWGFGPGYHAPLVLGPPHCGPIVPQRVIRLPCAPHGVGVGCEGCDLCGVSELPPCQFPSAAPASPIEYPAPTLAAPPVAIERQTPNVTPIPRPLFEPPSGSFLGH